MKNSNQINDGYPLGKGEVVSSILTGSTDLCPCLQPILHCPTPRCRHFDTEPSANTTSGYGRDSVALFPRRSRG